MKEEDCFSTTLAPICFALLSDKVREKTASLTKLHSVLPVSVKQKDFTSETAEKVIKSFLDWLQAELRISKRAQNTSAITSSLKEIKWLISLFDANFPRINLSKIVLEVIDRLTDVLAQKCSFTEALYILNHQILCKLQYLKEFRDSKLTSRFNRLLTVLAEQVTIAESPEPFIKSLSYLAISLPYSLKLEPYTYEMFHESFLWYFRNPLTKNESTLPALLSAVNSLLLDYFEHSTRYTLEYFPHILPFIRNKNSAIFHKALQYFLQVKQQVSHVQIEQLASQLLSELEEPQHCPLYSIDPVFFCKQVFNRNYLTLNDFIRKMFLQLCADYIPLDYENSIPLTLYRFLSGLNISMQSSIPQLDSKKIRNSFDWTNLLQFHAGKLFSSLENGSKHLSWYKLWYISMNPARSPDINMEELDIFVERSIRSNSSLDSLAFDALASYFNLRFKGLWWTASAKETFSSLLNCLLLNDNLTLEDAFYKCILSPLDLPLHSFTTLPDIDDPKALDCSLFLKRLDHLRRKTKILARDYSDEPSITSKVIDFNLPTFYAESLKNFISRLSSDFIEESDVKKIINLNFLKLIVSLLDTNCEISNCFDDINSFKINLISLLGQLIVEKIEITSLLSELIPELENLNNTDKENCNVDEDFRSKNSKFEVNVTLAEVFKANEAESSPLTTLANVLLKSYTQHLQNLTMEQEQILNDWKLFMIELNCYKADDCVHVVPSAQTVANALREIVPYFDFPFDLNNCVNFELAHIFPNPSLIVKKISAPEQWMPFVYLLFESEKSSTDLILEWLLVICEKECSGTLFKFISENADSSLFQELLKRWIETGKPLQKFPFTLTSTPPHEFILKSPHFPLILSKFPSIGHLLEQFIPKDEMRKAISENLSYLAASCLLEESSAKLSNRNPVDFSFCKTSSITSIKFLDLVSILLLHGQWYKWPVLVSSLQSLAKMFKLSAATDFSEIFNPVHSVLILRRIVPLVHDYNFLKNLFNNIPILSHHPQLLNLCLNLLESTRKRTFRNESCNLFKKAAPNPTIAITDSETEQNDLISFLLAYARPRIFSNDFSVGLFELVYKLLNLSHVNGNRMFPLDCFDKSIREDLKMFVLPLGSKVLCFNSAEIDEKDENIENFMEISMNSKGKVLKSFILFLLSTLTVQNPNTSIITSMNATYSAISEAILKEYDSELSYKLLPILLDSFNDISSSFSLYPQIIKKLTEGLEHENGEALREEIVNILQRIIEKTPIGPNVVDTLLRRFSFNPKMFKLLQSTSKYSIYFYSLLRESPKSSQIELDLGELGDIFASMGEDEYFTIVKKRLSKFESFEMEWPKCDGINIDNFNDHLWLDKKWFDRNDFKPKNLSIEKFELQANNFKNLRQLLLTGSSGNLPADMEIIKIIENCQKNRKSPNFKDILKVASDEPSEINFNGISLLSLISPKMDQVSKHLLMDISSKIHWKRGELELALETSKGALAQFPAFLPDEAKALLLSRIGEWAAASKLERPSHILSQYLEKAMTLCENTSNFSPASLAQIHIKVARFVDDQYQQIKESEDFKSRAKLLEESKAALTAARAASTTNTQDRRQLEISISTLRSQYDLDMQEYSERLRSLNAFLIKSVQNYISALNFGTCNLSESEQMAAVSRLCALWFSNSDFAAINDLINTSITSSGKRSLPLQLFLPLIYQLAARASYDPATASPSHFQRTLMRLLAQLTLQYPFDCIYQLLALRSGSDGPVNGAKRRKLLDEENGHKSEADLRAAAATVIIDQTRKISLLSTKVSAVEVLVDAYIELADYPPPTQLKSSTVIEFSASLKIKKLLYPLPIDSPLRQVPIVTGPSDGETFAGFIDGYKLLGGINLPKQIEAVSVNGARHAQLVKGKDDVRQDAVMEQVFLRVNKLLSASEETRKRKLKIRTYRVIPLRPLVGLLEWVSDSVPLATFLTEAHERLRPGDLHPTKCRELLRAEAERPGSTIQSKLNVLLKEIGQRFRPVLRYFFFEHFNVANWWTAKQAYTSSMATASIVGWIVGLGDRHGMNILLDKRSGEIVHIDLNMIFEAGRTLRIPERVPFRLTPDCVDGLGPEGIGLDGPFKNHAIATLKVLRKERSLLMMIMDVFKYDPLQKWTGIAKAIENKSTPLNSINNNNTSASSDLITKEADRALMRIKEKLEGREEGVVLSEAGHVAFLIQTAMDPELLCQMYFGWQAYF